MNKSIVKTLLIESTVMIGDASNLRAKIPSNDGYMINGYQCSTCGETK